MNLKKYIAAVLAAVLMMSLLAGCVDPEPTQPENTTPQTEAPQSPTEEQSTTVPTDPAKPEPTQPEATDPETTEPEPTQPEATDPETTEPEPTQPEATDPETTEPEPTQTEATEPKPTEPKPTEPAPSEPEIGSQYTRAELEAMDTKVNGWGPGVNKDEANRPYGAINEQKKYGEYDAYFIAPAEGQIYLTFDEGYENGYTPKILDVLKEKGVKAVFFVTMPYCKSHPDLVQRMIDEGHAVGNHSVRHKSMPTLSIDDMVKEVVELHDYVKEQFGYEMHLFRPPMGEYSQQSLAVLQSLGYKTVQWSFAYYDYEPEDQMEPTKAYKKVTEAAHEGAIYLLHAISETNTEILGDVIDYMVAQGYELKLFD